MPTSKERRNEPPAMRNGRPIGRPTVSSAEAQRRSNPSDVFSNTAPAAHGRAPAAAAPSASYNAAGSPEAHVRTTSSMKGPKATVAKASATSAQLNENTAPSSSFHFDVYPTEVVFSSFEANKTYTATLELRNTAHTNQFVRVVKPDSNVFSVAMAKGGQGKNKVAPGLSCVYEVTFTPTEDHKDYFCNLHVQGEDEEVIVPLRALAHRGHFDLPSEVALTPAPAKGSSETTLFLRHSGKEPCVWRAMVVENASGDAAGWCSIAPDHGVVAPTPVSVDGVDNADSVVPVTIRFNPGLTASGASYSGTLRFLLGPEGDAAQDVRLCGVVKQLGGVALEQTKVEFADTYVMTERQAVVCLRNDSNETVRFAWKNSFAADPSSRSSGRVAPIFDTEVDTLMEEDDKFDDEVFSVEPTCGVLYARGVREFTITFNPHFAMPTEVMAYLEVTGQSARLPLQLSGCGLGPQVELEYNRLEVGDVYVRAVHEYKIDMTNTGPIECQYSIVPCSERRPTVFTSKFRFSPATGTLAPGEAVTLTVELESDAIGSFAELFRVHLRGSAEEVPLLFKGNVVGPSFHFDVEELDFGNVSYNFYHSRVVYLSNTSMIPMRYAMHLPEGCMVVDEFTVTPASGQIQPGDTQEIKIQFLSNTIGTYDTAMVMDIAEVGPAVVSLPMKATCIAAPLTITTEKVQYGSIFVGHPNTLNVEVSNDTALSGKYYLEVAEKEVSSSSMEVVIGTPLSADGTVMDGAEGGPYILPPRQTAQVPVTLTARRTGPIVFSLVLHVLGMDTSVDPAPTVLATGAASGPNVEALMTSLNYGVVAVLESAEKFVSLTNTSPIPAPFHAAFARQSASGDAHSVFTVEPASGVLDPHGTAQLKVIACLDDATAEEDTLCVQVENQEEATLPRITVKATGKGFPLVPAPSVNTVDLGDVFTNTPVSQEVVVHNRGRYDYEVQWHNIRGSKVKEGAPPIVFCYKPERAVIPAQESVTFVVEGLSASTGTLTDTFSLKQSGSFQEVLRSEVRATFMEPMLAYSANSVSFHYTAKDDVHQDREGPTMVKSLTLKNTTSKSLVLHLRIRTAAAGEKEEAPKSAAHAPFELQGLSSVNLAPGESCAVAVHFNPLYRGDCVSHAVKGRLLVSFDQHDRKESVPLSASMNFPELSLDPSAPIDFGTVLCDSEQRRSIVLKNPSAELAAHFLWKMERNVADDETEFSSELLHSTESFDIIPYTGTIAPGGQQVVEAVFKGHAGTASATAVCQVVNGRPYSIPLRAVADTVRVHVDKTSIDFGVLQYYSTATQVVTLINDTGVVVPFEVDLRALSAAGAVRVSPMSGQLADKVKLFVSFTPNAPHTMEGSFAIQAGCLTPMDIAVRGCGQLNSLALSCAGSGNNAVTVQRETSAAFAAARETCRREEAVASDQKPWLPYVCQIGDVTLPSFVDALGLEAERRLFCDALEKKQRGGGEAADTEHVSYRNMRRSSVSAKGTVKPVLSHYIVDFGHLTRNNKMEMKLRVTNTSLEPVVIMLDSKEVAKTALSVSPMKSLKVLHMDSVTLEVQMDATKGEPFVRHGINSYEFTIDVKGGPAVVVECRCYVATPLLRPPEKTVDFGSVLVGMVKVLPFVLTNPEGVPCPWKVICKEVTPKSEASGGVAVVDMGDVDAPDGWETVPTLSSDAKQFWVSCDHGVAKASGEVALELFFAPRRASHPCAAVLRFACGNATTMVSNYVDVRLSGDGRALQVSLSNQRVILPPVRPGQIHHESITINNDEDYPIEVYLMQLDDQFAKERRILSQALALQDSGKLFTDARNAGERLPKEVLEQVYQSLHVQSEKMGEIPELAAEVPASAAEQGGGEKPQEEDAKPGAAQKGRGSGAGKRGGRGSARGNGASSASSRRGSSAQQRGAAGRKSYPSLLKDGNSASRRASGSVESSKAATAAPGSSPCELVVLVGPHQCGKTTVAQLLESDARFELISLNGLLEKAAAGVLATPSLHQLLQVFKWMSQQAEKEKEKAVEEIGEATAADAATEESATPQERPLNDGEEASDASHSSLSAEEEEEEEQEEPVDASVLENIPTILKDVVTSFLESAKKRPEAVHLVMDSVECSLTPNRRVCVEALVSACEGLAVTLKFVSIDVSANTCLLHQIAAKQLDLEMRIDQSDATPISEEDFEKLSLEERTTYNTQLQRLNQWRREVTKCIEERHRLTAQAPQPAVQESVEERWRARQEAASASQGSGRKSVRTAKGKKAPAPAPVDAEKSKEVDWAALSSDDLFAELYMAALAIESRTVPRPVTGKKKSMIPTAPAVKLLFHVDAEGAESPATVVDRLRAELAAAGEADGGVSAIPAVMGGGQTPSAAPPPEELFVKSITEPTKPGGEVAEDVREEVLEAAALPPVGPGGVGEWCYIDGPRLRSLNELSGLYLVSRNLAGEVIPVAPSATAANASCVRFLSMVERAVVVDQKNNLKKKPTPLPDVVRQKEEVTRWTLPAKSSATVEVEFCSEQVGSRWERSLVGVVGAMQFLPLDVKAQVALPDIVRDVRYIFPVVKNRLPTGVSAPKTYMLNKKQFDFGPLLVPAPAPPKRRGNAAEKADRRSSASAAHAAAIALSPLEQLYERVVAEPKTKLDERTERLTFVSGSAGESNVSLTFMNEKEKTFTVIPSSFKLFGSGSTQTVLLQAHPEKVAEITNTLMVCVEDNPVPWTVEVSCVGSRPMLTMNGSKELHVAFERTVLQRKVEQTVTLVNESPLPLMWKLQEMEAGKGLPAEITFDALTGVIDGHSAQAVRVSFAPKSTCLHSITLNMVVSDPRNPAVLYETLPVTVKAEGHDVVLEWAREVDFGLLHVGETKTEVLRVMNKSPYEVGFQLRLPKRLQRMIQLSPASGTIRGMVGHRDAAIANIEVTAYLDKEGELPLKLSEIEAAFFDTAKDELLYPLQSIPIKGQAWYTNYTVKPGVVNFGSCRFGERREAEFEIRNTGHFPVNYQLFSFTEGCRELAAAAVASRLKDAQNGGTGAATGQGEVGGTQNKETAGPRRPNQTGRSASASGKRGAANAKATESEFTLGSFVCSPFAGTVPVGEKRVIKVAVCPMKQGGSKELLGIFVDQSQPDLEARGTPIDLLVYPSTPAIAANLASPSDVDMVFEEQRVVYKLDQVEKGTRAYGKEDRMFSFGTALVNNRTEERFRLANTSPLPCTITASLTSASAAGGAGSTAGAGSNGNSGRKSAAAFGAPEGFDITCATDSTTLQSGIPGVVKMVLPPFESRFVVVGFCPSSLNRYDARLVATVEGGTEGNGNRLAFDLTGQGTLPSVEYVMPPMLGSAEVPQPSKRESRASSSNLQLPNRQGDAKRPPSSTSPPASATSGRKKSMPALVYNAQAPQPQRTSALCNSMEMDLPLTRIGTMSTRSFKVRNVGSVTAEVRFEVMTEETALQGLTLPKKFHTVSIAPGAWEDVEVRYAPTTVGSATMRLQCLLADNPFEEKELVVTARSFDQVISFGRIDPAHADVLNLGDCFVGQERRQSFTMQNNSSSTVRYAWTMCPEGVALTPSVGHLSPGERKEIVAMVTVESGWALGGANAQFQLLHCGVEAQSIQLTAPATWDNSLVSPKWVLSEEDRGSQFTDTAAVLAATHAGRRNLKQVMEPVAEPEFRLLPEVQVSQPLTMVCKCGVPQHQLQVASTATSAVPQTFVSLDEGNGEDVVHFPTTKLFQKRVATLRVSNTGAVGLPFKIHTGPSHTVAGSAGAAGEDGSGVDIPGTEFAADPAQGTVAPGETAEVKLCFAPTYAGKRTAECVAEFPYSEQNRVSFRLQGEAVCPLVHFQVPDTDYVQQRTPGDGSLLDQLEHTEEAVVVIPFTTRGVNTRATVKFTAINPSATTFNYEWTNSLSKGGVSPFRCLNPTGTMVAGKQLSMGFEFFADTLGVHESLWMFTIPGQTSIPFLLVGRAVEPNVLFSSSKLHFGGVHVGNSVEKTVFLENKDDTPLSYHFDKSSMEGTGSFLTVKPLSATVGPQERLPVTLTFTPQDEIEYNVPLVCHVKKSSVPLSINVKGEGVCVHETLEIKRVSAEQDAARRESLREGRSQASADDTPFMAVRGEPMMVHLGRVQVNTQVTYHFILTNTGSHPFEYSVAMPERRFFTMEGGKGVLQAKQRAVVSLTYHPTQEESLRQCRLQVRVGGKVAYKVGLQGVAYTPRLAMNLDKCNFGPRFITAYQVASGGASSAGSSELTASKVLTLTNNDSEDVNVECCLSEGNRWCRLDSTSLLVRAHEAATLRLLFNPTDAAVYEDVLTLLLNGVHRTLVPVTGEGVVPRVEVMQPFAKLGVARVGQTKRVEVRLECRSKIPTPVSFAGCIDDDLVTKGIAVKLPQAMMVLQPREAVSVVVEFTPTQRMGEFTREMKMLVCGNETPFAVVSGSCEDAEVHLDSSSASFLDIVAGSSATRRVVILNSGDLSQKFSWSVSAQGGPSDASSPLTPVPKGKPNAAGGKRGAPVVEAPVLVMNPSSGFIRAHTEFACEIRYIPTKATSEIVNYTLTLTLDNAPPLSMAVEASCVARPAAKERLQFRCRARESDVQYITIENPTAQSWTFTPVMDNPVWSVPSQVTVKPKAKADVVVTYQPMSSTTAVLPDRGMLFVPQENGTGMSFSLEGVAERAGPSGPEVNVEVATESPANTIVEVKNWSDAALRFLRTVEWVPQGGEEAGAVVVEGPAAVEVPPESSKSCPLIIFGVRQGTYRGQLFFRCSERPEMDQFFEIVVRVSGATASTSAELRAAVRETTSYAMALPNPHPKAITYSVRLDGVDADSMFSPAMVTVAPKSTLQHPIFFLPLISKPYGPVKCTVACPETETKEYVFQLSTTPAALERTTRLVCPLGQSVTFALKFQHLSRQTTDYTVRMAGQVGGTAGADSARVAGSASRAASAPPVNPFARTGGQGNTLRAAACALVPTSGLPKPVEMVAEFTFEPAALGDVREVVEFTSPLGGTFSFPIVGSCIAPQRQGPFVGKTGQNIQIPFRNVFGEAVSVSVVSDSPFFVPVKKTETIAPKKTANVAVQCKGDDALEVTRGKVIVSCVPPGQQDPVEWLHYVEATRTGAGVGAKSSQKRK